VERHLGKIFSQIIGSLEIEEAFQKRGRPYFYSTRSIIKGFLIMVGYRLTSIRSLARFLEKHPELREICQFRQGKSPSYRTFLRRFGLLDHWVFEWCRILITFLIEAKLLNLKILVIDGTPSRADGALPKGGKKFKKSDPEAGFGYTNKGKLCFFGYKTIILATSEPLIVPLSWKVIPANHQEVNELIPLTSKAAWLFEKGKHYEMVADSGFDAQLNYDWLKGLGIRLTCPLNLRGKKDISLSKERLRRLRFYQSKLGQGFFKRRDDIERLNNHLKDLFLIDPFPIRRLKRINTYLNLVMLLYLAGLYYNFTTQRPLKEIKSLIA